MEFDKLLEKLRRAHGLPPRSSAKNLRFDQGSASPTVASTKPKLKRLRAKARLADNPKARAAAEAFRDAMRGGK